MLSFKNSMKKYKPQVDYTNEYIGIDGSFDPTKDINHDNDFIPKKVPVEFRGMQVPSNIKYFITGIYPNLEYAVHRSLFSFKGNDKKAIVSEIIANAIIYLFGENKKDKIKNGVVIIKKGSLRYTNYDSSILEYSKIPYYRWFITQVLFFTKTFKSKLFNEKSSLVNEISLESMIRGNSSFSSDEENLDYLENKIMSNYSKSNELPFSMSNGFDAYLLKERSGAYEKNLTVVNLDQSFNKNELSFTLQKVRKEIELFQNGLLNQELKSDYFCIVEVFDLITMGLKRKQMISDLKISRDVLNLNIKKIKQILALNFPRLKKDLISSLA